MSKSYIPIACALHDEYEIAIMQKKHLNIKWVDEVGQKHSAYILPIDILVENKEEFLIADSGDNRELKIRMDKITLLAV